jgi:hypothetical protein
MAGTSSTAALITQIAAPIVMASLAAERLAAGSQLFMLAPLLVPAQLPPTAYRLLASIRTALEVAVREVLSFFIPIPEAFPV